MSIAGLDLGGTKVLGRIVDPVSGKLSHRVKAPTPAKGFEAVVDLVSDAVRDLSKTSGETISAVGLGVPGPVRPDGLAGPCPNIAGWNEPFDLGNALRKTLGIEVTVANDVDCAILGEQRFGAATGCSNVLGVWVGTGVGGGLVINGELVRGPRGLAGEIGHMVVVPDGEPCGCGGRGHLESYAGRAGMARRALDLSEAANSDPANGLLDAAGAGKIRSKTLAQAIEAGDPLGWRLLNDAAAALAPAISALTVALDLERIVLGGGIVDRLGDELIAAVTASPGFGGFSGVEPVLIRADSVDDAGVLGAGLLAAAAG